MKVIVDVFYCTEWPMLLHLLNENDVYDMLHPSGRMRFPWCAILYFDLEGIIKFVCARCLNFEGKLVP